jgi:hypothetical protein
MCDLKIEILNYAILKKMIFKNSIRRLAKLQFYLYNYKLAFKIMCFFLYIKNKKNKKNKKKLTFLRFEKKSFLRFQILIF